MELSIEDAVIEFQQGRMEKCERIVTEILATQTNNIDALLLRAKLYYSWQKWGSALNDLNRILELDVNNEIAKNYKEMVINIISYWNKDNYNP